VLDTATNFQLRRARFYRESCVGVACEIVKALQLRRYAHGGSPDCQSTAVAELCALVPGCEGQQGDVPSLLDGPREPALVRGADASEAAGHNLAAFGYKPLQQTDIPIGDGIDLLSAELADLLAAEELAAAAGTTGS
jgi:hypothetical protein